MNIETQPLTPERWRDLVELFERPGASIARTCFCMAYRRSGKHVRPAGVTYSQSNRRALKSLVDRGIVPGLIAYEDDRPVGWISLGPREQYARLERSPVMKPVDDKPVWSIICFFVDAKARHRGIAKLLLDAGVRWARENGATLLESYPCDRPPTRDENMWFGSKSMFDDAGFVEVARRKPARPVMRRTLHKSSSAQPKRAGD